MNNKPLSIFIFLFFINFFSFSQQNSIDSLQQILSKSKSVLETAKINIELSKAYERLDIAKGREFATQALLSDNDSIKSEAYNQIGRSFFFTNELDSAKHYFENSIRYLESIELHDKVANVRISIGAVALRKGEYEGAISSFIESLTFFELKKDSINMAKCYTNISSAFGELGEHRKAIDYGERALHIIKIKKLTQFEIVILPNLAGLYLKTGDTLAAEKNYLAAEKLALQLNDPFSQSIIYNNLGNMYLNSNPDKSQFYLIKALTIREQSKNLDGLGTLYNNLGFLHLNKNEYRNGLPYFLKALNLSKGTKRITVLNNLANTYENIGDQKNALKFLKEKFTLNDSILQSDKQKTILELSTKYETEKKEREILNLQNENLQIDAARKNNISLFIIIILVLISTIFFGFLIFKNSKRKQIIVQQQQALEFQKVEQLLKNQELIGIDAMIEGQEQERTKMANDLHDNLGSKIATLKLYTDELKEDENISETDRKALLEKVSLITEDTYKEVRKMAHFKNFSTYIDKGLIPSTAQIAKLVTNSKKIKIDVINVDVKETIDPAIEIQVFRCIQELITNIIKHAMATEAIIQFSEDLEKLTVIIEDNGKGFDTSLVSQGLGLTNIHRRIENINGEIMIDSSHKNGTTIILTIPL